MKPTSGEWLDIAAFATGAVVPWTGPNLERCDPYLVWAEASTDPVPRMRDTAGIAVLIELIAASDYADFLDRLIEDRESPRPRFVPNGFEPSDGAPGTRFITGLVSRAGLKQLVDEVLEKRILRFSIQAVRTDLTVAQREAATVSKQACARPQNFPGAGPDPIDEPRARPGTFLGLIDDGLPFLKLRTALGGASWLWDQGWQTLERLGKAPKPVEPDDKYWRGPWDPLRPKGSSSAKCAGFLYGRRLKSLPPKLRGGPAGEGQAYASSSYFVPPPRETHGAGVLGLLAPWLSTQRGPVQWPNHVSGLAMVQLPTVTVNDTSGGSLAMRVLDGLRFVLWKERVSRPRACREPRQIVANVSYGVHAGPHDGTSMFEAAAQEMLDSNPTLQLVLPAGNSHLARCHAVRHLSAAGAAGDEATLAWSVMPDNARDSFMEIWLPHGVDVALTLTPPGQQHGLALAAGDAKVFVRSESSTPGGEVVEFAAIHAPSVAQGLDGTMILLAVGSTRKWNRAFGVDLRLQGVNQQPRKRVQGRHGLWRLTLTNRSRMAATINAWSERGDAPPDGRAGSRQAFFPDTCTESMRQWNAEPEGTLNGIAAFVHPRLHVVGAMRLSDGVVSDYSAAGSSWLLPGRYDGPDVVVPGDRSKSLPGLRTSGFVEGGVSHISGTSAACAVYARALAASLAQTPPRLPSGYKPAEAMPGIECLPEESPRAYMYRRGHALRMMLPVDVDGGPASMRLTTAPASLSTADNAPHSQSNSPPPNPSSTDSPSPANTPAGSPSPCA